MIERAGHHRWPGLNWAWSWLCECATRNVGFATESAIIWWQIAREFYSGCWKGKRFSCRQLHWQKL